MSGAGDDLPDDPRIRAGEYVLGVLDAAELASVRLEAMRDRALAAAIVEWEVQLAPMASIVQPVEVPPDLWRRIEISIGAPAATLETLRAPASLWRSSGLWRATTAAALALAAAFAAVAYLPHVEPPMRVAALVPPGAPAPAFLAQARADGTVVVSAVAPASVPNDRDLELWLLAPGAQRPTSLGVLPAGGRTVTISGLPQDGTQLLVSLEPRGGSPTGQPTGPVLYGGTLASR